MAKQTEQLETEEELLEPIVSAIAQTETTVNPLTDEPTMEELNKAKAPSIGFRVNRQGKEIFSGGKNEFEEAVKAQKIRADDLIWDHDSNSWTFARNHGIFRSSNQAALDLLLKKRRAKERKTWILRGLVSFTVISAIMWVLVHYSKKLEFNPKENMGAFSDSAEETQPTDSTDKSKSAAQGADQSNVSFMDNIELNDLELEKKSRKQEKQNQEKIDMVFDLNADGNQAFLEHINQNEALSDEKLLGQAQKLFEYPGVNLQDSNQALQEAFGIVDFVLNRLKRENKNDQIKASAQNLQKRLESKFKSQCDKLHGSSFCQIKLKHMTWSDQTILAIHQQKILIGMNKEQAFEAWGNPSKENKEGKLSTYCYDPSCQKSYQIKLGKVIAFTE